MFTDLLVGLMTIDTQLDLLATKAFVAKEEVLNSTIRSGGNKSSGKKTEEKPKEEKPVVIEDECDILPEELEKKLRKVSKKDESNPYVVDNECDMLPEDLEKKLHKISEKRKVSEQQKSSVENSMNELTDMLNSIDDPNIRKTIENGFSEAVKEMQKMVEALKQQQNIQTPIITTVQTPVSVTNQNGEKVITGMDFSKLQEGVTYSPTPIIPNQGQLSQPPINPQEQKGKEVTPEALNEALSKAKKNK